MFSAALALGSCWALPRVLQQRFVYGATQPAFCGGFAVRAENMSGFC